MPKVKKAIRAPALASRKARHDPLGQVIEGDAIRGKYAAPSRGRNKTKKNEGTEEEFLDEKTTKKILDLTKEQQVDLEVEHHREWQRKNQNQQTIPALDSDDEENEEVEEVFIDEGDE